MFSSAPWLLTDILTVEIIEMLAEGGSLSVVFDVLYSGVQVVIGCSPLVYLLTTNSLRKVFLAMLASIRQNFNFLTVICQ